MFKVTPLRAVALAGIGYGTAVYCMHKYYYQNSRLRQIYVEADPKFADIKIMAPRDMRAKV